jgi:hypothetical protein
LILFLDVSDHQFNFSSKKFNKEPACAIAQDSNKITKAWLLRFAQQQGVMAKPHALRYN